MAPKTRIYWDTSCFISYLSGTNPDEIARSLICEDILKHARNNDDFEIWTSVYTIVETIRPKSVYKPCPAPLWAELLNVKNPEGNFIHPEAGAEFDKIWNYYKRNTLPAQLLSEDQAIRIKQMFDWSWIKTVQVIPVIAHRAADIARIHKMKPADSIHVATALYKNCEAIHRWDKDFKKTDGLIPSQDPVRMSLPTLLDMMVNVRMIENEEGDKRNGQTEGNNKANHELEANSAHTATVRGSDEGRLESEAASEVIDNDAVQVEIVPEKPKTANKGGLSGDGS